MRRSHHKLNSVNIVEDKKSGEYKLSHHIDLKSGYYNGKNSRYIINWSWKKFPCNWCNGGDNSPDKTVEGIKFFLEKNKSNNDFVLNLFGKKNTIENALKKFKVESNNINIFNCDLVVSDDASPLSAIKSSKNSSMWNCIKHQVDGKSDISLSAGNTGVLLVTSKMILKMMKDVSKPALAALWPSNKGLNVVLDLGANIDCDDQNLIEFAELGSALYKSLFQKTNLRCHFSM